jgi:hypothetical protein
MFHRLHHRLFGDGVEHDPLDLMRFQRTFLAQHFQHVPGNRLALAVRIGGEDELVGAFERVGDVGQPFLRLGINLPDHAEIGIGIDRTIFRRQVAHMAEGGQDLIVGPQIFVDGLGLGRRLDDDNLHKNPVIFVG